MAPWSRATIKGAPLALLAVLGCLALADHRDPRTGIEIRTDAVFPASWVGGEVNAGMVPLDPAEHMRSVSLAQSAMALYPVELLRKNLKSVQFAKELRFYGLAYGGTNSGDAVYIANRGAAEGYTDAFLTSAFHHELSSILLRNYAAKFDAHQWASNNRPGVDYGAGGIEALKGGRAETAYKPKYNVDGFLNEYGKSSLEEDFNTFAEGLFGGDRAFWVIVDRYPRLEAKAKLAIAFYASLDPQFSEEFFRGLANKR